MLQIPQMYSLHEVRLVYFAVPLCKDIDFSTKYFYYTSLNPLLLLLACNRQYLLCHGTILTLISNCVTDREI